MKHAGTREIRTERLVLRRFREDDAKSMYDNWAGDPQVTKYLTWPTHTSPDATGRVIASWVESYAQPDYYQWAIELDGAPIGSIALVAVSERNESVEVGYCIGRPWWGRGIMTEAAEAVMDFCFRELGVHRFIGCHDAENIASGRVMEKLGMVREGLFRGHWKRGDGAWADIVYRAILREEWERRSYARQRCRFEDFYPLPELTDGEISLVCAMKTPADPARGHVPAYTFDVMRGGQRIGRLNLRIGYPDGLFFGGNVGYRIEEPFRGHGYAGRACRLAAAVMRLHGMQRATITNDVDNAASRRVCEKLGARFVARAEVPENYEMRARDGIRFVNIYEFSADGSAGEVSESALRIG